MSGKTDTVGAKSGIVGSDVYPSGHVIQTVTNFAPSWQRAWNGEGNNWVGVDDGAVIITPAAGNKIILWACFMVLPSSDAHLYLSFERVNADGTNTNITGETYGAARVAGANIDDRVSFTWMYHDTGFKANSANTYSYSVQSTQNTTFYIGNNDTGGGISAMEVQV